MRWIEAAVDTPAEEIDERCEKLATLGCGGFVIESEEDFKGFIRENRQYWGVVDEELQRRYEGVSRIKFYIADDDGGRAVLAAVKGSLGCEVHISYVQDSDWENNWRQYYKPIEIGNRLVVVPEWEQIPDDGRVPLLLEPGLTFGTGDHPTTRLCLEGLEDAAGPGKRALPRFCWAATAAPAAT